MPNRREFIIGTAAATAVAVRSEVLGQSKNDASVTQPVAISTWKHGLAANAAAWEVLSGGGQALDAVEAGVRVSESDPRVTSVGYGGRPDRQGDVTLDACIMSERGDCGSVAFLQHIENPVSVARLVMEKTPHVMLVGEGALQFAVEQGFKRKRLLTDDAEQEWRKWKSKHPNAVGERDINVENHDTIGLLALDKRGNLSGACTTSGLAWKLHGRVGDSPIIGAGLYVDNEIGAASATGLGEAVIRAVGSFLVVELMRQGHSPQNACRLTIERVIAKNPEWQSLQVGFIAINKQGHVGGYSIQTGFQYATYDAVGGNKLVDSKSRIQE